MPSLDLATDTNYRTHYSRMRAAALIASTLMFGHGACQAAQRAEAADEHHTQRIVLLIGPQATSLSEVARRILQPEKLEVVPAAQSDLDSSVRDVRNAALRSEGSLRAAVEHLDALLKTNGFQPNLLPLYGEIVVISAKPIPIDLIDVGGTPLGMLTVISHIIASDSATLEADLAKVRDAQPVAVNRAALLSIAKLDQGVSRKNHDIIQAALKLSDRIPVDILIAPDSTQSLSYFSRKDVQILHIDTHGTSDSVQLGTRDERFWTIDELPAPILPAFVLLVGCSTGSSERSLGPQLVHRGAGAVVGMPFDFRTGAPSGGDISNPAFYDALWAAILDGETIGSAVLKAKQTLPKNIYSAMWLIFGNAELKFSEPNGN